MDESKDYYRILGVLPSAEPELIKAAFRALSKLYHPDVNPTEGATAKMVEITEAYAVLSNKGARAYYDSVRDDTHEYQSDNSFADGGSEGQNNPLRRDWEIAAKYHPEILELERSLTKVSHRLAFAFKAYLLETKDFANSNSVARDLRKKFLQEYFGEDPEIIDFARGLIESSQKSALKELNRVVRVVGNSLPSATLIKRIKTDFGLLTEEEKFLQFVDKEGLSGYLYLNRRELYCAWKEDPKRASSVINQIHRSDQSRVSIAAILFYVAIFLIVACVLWFSN